MDLADDRPAVWQAATTTAAERQQIVRLLVQRVEVEVQGESERVAVPVTWAGGLTSQHETVRPVRHYRQRSDYTRLLKRIKELREKGKTLEVVAEQLNREGFQPPKRVTAFTANMVGHLLRRQCPTGAAAVRRDGGGLLKEQEWWPADLAARLGMPAETMTRWMRVDRVNTRRRGDSRNRWVVWADDEELERLTRLRATDPGWGNAELRARLTVPKPRPTQE